MASFPGFSSSVLSAAAVVAGGYVGCGGKMERLVEWMDAVASPPSVIAAGMCSHQLQEAYNAGACFGVPNWESTKFILSSSIFVQQQSALAPNSAFNPLPQRRVSCPSSSFLLFRTIFAAALLTSSPSAVF